MSDLLKQIGERIWKRRKQLHFTQDELAERAGMTSQTISTAENGTKALRPENIIKICTALDISTDYLLLGSIAEEDKKLLYEKLSKLSSEQYRYLEDIIDSFIAAVNIKET